MNDLHVKDSMESWPPRLDTAIADCELFNRVIVLRETDSTQDAAKRMSAGPGSIIVAGRQTAGRGRLGRTWIDEFGEGIAVTLVVQRGEPEHLAMATAIGTARAAEAALGSAVGIKWPNDIVVQRRKLAGILVEQVDDQALIGVGMNVMQTAWPNELAERAVSLRQLDCSCQRIDVLAKLIPAIDHALCATIDALVQQFAPRDALRNTASRLKNNGRIYEGLILQVDPSRGLRIQCDDGEHWLPAATTSIEQHHDHPGVIVAESR